MDHGPWYNRGHSVRTVLSNEQSFMKAVSRKCLHSIALRIFPGILNFSEKSQ